MERDDKYCLVYRLPFFQWLDEEIKAEFLTKSKVLKFKRFQNLTEEMKWRGKYLIIIEGAIKIAHSTKNGMLTLRIINKESFYVELDSLLINDVSKRNKQIMANVIGKNNGCLLMISNELFYKIRSNNQQLFRFFEDRKFNYANLRLEKKLVHSMVKPRDRVIGCLYLTGKYFSRDVEDGKIIEKWITMDELANYASTTKRTVINVYKDLQKQNLLEKTDHGERKLKVGFWEKYADFI